MPYQEIVYLISQVKGVDNIGNDIISSETRQKIYAKAQSVKTNEFYSAVEVGLTPSVEFVIK